MQTRKLLSVTVVAALLMLVMLSAVLVVRAAGPTTVSGIITGNTTWTAANSPYVVTGSIRVNPGVTLTIQPGVQVKFNGAYRILVQGTLNAIGTPAQHVVFTSNKAAPAAGDWQGITFDDSCVDATLDGSSNYVSGTTLQYVDVLYGGTVLAFACTPYISHSRFAYNFAMYNATLPRYTSDVATVTFYSAINTRFDHNIVEHNSGGAIRMESSNSSVIEDNLFVANTGGSWSSGIGDIYGNAIIRNNVFADNNAMGMAGAYFAYEGATELSHNSFIRNYSPTLESDGGGSALGYWSTEANVHHNTFVDHSGFSVIHLNRVSTHMHFTFNNIVGNPAQYDMYVSDYGMDNAQSLPIDATQNYWAESSLSAIQQRINLIQTEFGEPVVAVQPFRTAPVLDAPVMPPANFTRSAQPSGATIAWSANPESDIAGYKVYYDYDGGYPYSYVKDVGNVTSYTLTGLPAGIQHFAVTAYDSGADGVDDFTDGHESWFSQEDPPLSPPTPPGVDTPTPEPPTPTETPTPTPTLEQGPTPTATLIPLPTITVEPGATPTATPKPYSFTINNGAIYTNDVNVTLSLTAPPNGLQMMISNDGGFAGATWEPFAPTKAWQITQYGGAILPRTVYVRFSGPGGLITAQDDIILDVTPPTGSVQVLVAAAEAQSTERLAATPAATTPAATTAARVLLPVVAAPLAPNTERVQLNLTATDDASGVGHLLVSSKADFAGAQWVGWSATQSIIDWIAPLHATTAVYVKFADNAGNISPTITGRITLP